VEKLRRIRLLRSRGLRLRAIAEILAAGDGPGRAAEASRGAPGVEALPAASASPAERQVWVKYTVAPGIEIEIARELEETERRRVAEIVRVARAILNEGGD